MNADVYELARASLLGHEGERLQAYDDATGKVVGPGDFVQGFVTVGVGRNLIGKGLTASESRHLFDNDITEVEAGLDARFPWWRSLSIGRQVALFDFAFNQGPAKLQRVWPNTMRMLEAGNYAGFSASLRKAPWYAQVGPARGEAVCRGIEKGGV